MSSRKKASTRQAAQASQAATAAHYANEDGNTLFPRFASAAGRARSKAGTDAGDELAGVVMTAEERRIRRRLDDLEKTNEKDLPFKLFQEGLAAQATGGAEAKRPAARKTTPAVRALLTASNRRTLADLLVRHPNPAYEHATSEGPTRPARRFCLPCGALGRYSCARCNEAVCSLACRDKHDEAGCLH